MYLLYYIFNSSFSSNYGLQFSLKEVHLTFIVRPVLWWWTPLTIVCLGNSIFPLSLWRITFPCRVFLVIGFFPFQFLKYFLLLPSGLLSFWCKISWYPYGVSLVCNFCFCLAAFKMLSLSLMFDILIIVCNGLDLFGASLEQSLELSPPWPRCLCSFPG